MTQSYYYHEDLRITRPPITWAVQRLILLNVILFVAQLVLDIPGSLWIDGAFAHNFRGFYPDHGPGGHILNTVLGYQSDLFVWGQIWKPFTYQFLHGGLSHLFWNMLLLFFFGPGLERVLGSRQFYQFYVACGAVAVLANLIPDYLTFGGGSFASVTGASGAVMGVVVAFVMIDVDRQFFLFPFPVPITGRALLLILVVINVLYAVMDTSVSVATHFGGMGFGYAYMRLKPRYTAWRRERRFRAQPNPGTRRDGGTGAEDGDIGAVVDNILKFKDKDWK